MSSRKNRARLIRLNFILLLILIALIGLCIFLARDEQSGDPADTTAQTTTLPDPTTAPTTQPTEPPIVKEASFTLSAVGDILMHGPVIQAGYSGGEYNFDNIFTYFNDYIAQADLAVGNLETTLASNDNGYAYNGYPMFNSPDAIIDSMKTSGFDMVLTANNHSYDTRTIGLTRTVDVIADRGLMYLGTKDEAADPNYAVVEINGIRLGLACYTYETDGAANDKALNGIPMKSADQGLINSFDYEHLDLFYREMAENITGMKLQRVDGVVVFMHWGNEYQTKQNDFQTTIAQKLCDMGVDVIIGGHPHVVQPVDLLTSTTDEDHHTVCLYSMGNAVSNQRRENISLKSGHSEDGLMFSVTFSRYTDGTVILESADALPLWVNHRTSPSTGRLEYTILPLDTDITDWKAEFDLSSSGMSDCEASYERTMKIVAEGMEEVNTFLAQRTEAVEAEIGVEK